MNRPQHDQDETDFDDIAIVGNPIAGDTELNTSWHMSQLEMSMGDFVAYAARSNIRGYSGNVAVPRQESVEEEEEDSFHSNGDDYDEDENDEGARYVEKDGEAKAVCVEENGSW